MLKSHTFQYLARISMLCLAFGGSSINAATQTALTTVDTVATTELSQQDAENLWVDAQQAFIHSEPESCYQNLLALSSLLLGEIAYDKLLGLCTTALNKHDVALLAYERIIAQQPQNAEIRLERAKSYYRTQQFQLAENEFKFLAANNPPAAASDLINRYLHKIQQTQLAQVPLLRVATRLNIGVKAGYDSNANSASELQDFLGFNVSDESRSTESSQYGVDVRLAHTRPISKQSQLSLSTSLGTKQYPDADFVKQNLATVSIGWTHFSPLHVNRVDTFLYGQEVANRLNSRGAFLRYSHNYRWKPQVDLGAYLKFGAIRYNESLQIKDINQYTIGFNALYRKAQQTLGFDVGFARDFPVGENPIYQRDIYSVNLKHAYYWSDKLSSHWSAAYYKYAYENPFFSLSFPNARADDMTSISGKLNWSVAKQWKLSPQVGFNDLESNVDIFQYDRWYAEIAAQYALSW